MKLADFIEPWILPIEHWSASSLNMLAICPRQWQQRYILGRKEAPGAARILGSANHDALGFNLTPKIESGEDQPLEDVIDYFNDEAWPKQLERAGGESEVQWDDGQNAEQQRRLGAQMVAAYRLSVAPRVEPAAVEQYIEVDVNGVPVPIIGYVDVRQKGMRPMIDMKTSKAKRTELKPDWRIQGRIYQLAIGRPVDWHVVTKAKVPSTWTGLDAPGLMQEVENAAITREMIRQLSTLANHYMTVYGAERDWPAFGINHDWRCNWCAYKSDCPAWST